MWPGDVVSPGLGCRDLHAAYAERTVVSDASVVITSGQVTALVGPNGSGKSTLLRALARLHRPLSGQIWLGDGTAAGQLSRRDWARRVTLLSQHRPAPSGLSVRDVVGFGRHPYRGRWGAADADGPRAIAWAMAVTGIVDMTDRAVDELSGGELQRVWLASCLAQDADTLLLDEPTNHLDLRFQVETLDLLRDLAVDHGVAVGVVLHDLNQAAEVADRLVLLCDGRVLATGVPADVLDEATLRAAYGVGVRVTRDPITSSLSVRPVGRHTAAPTARSLAP